MEWIWLVVGLVLGLLLGWWWVRRDMGPRLAQLQNDSDALAEDRSRLEGELHASTERGDRLAVELADASTLTTKTQGDLESVKAELEKSQHAVSESQRAAKAATHDAEISHAENAALAEKLKQAEHVAAEATTKFDQVTEEFVAVRRQARQAEQERDEALGDREGTVAELRASVAASESKAAETERTAREQLVTLTAERDRLERSLSIATARVEALEGSAEAASEAQEELGRLRTAVGDDRRKMDALEAELGQARARVAELESRASAAPSAEQVARVAAAPEQSVPVPPQEPAEPQHEPESWADSTGPEIESPVGEVAPEPPEPAVVESIPELDVEPVSVPEQTVPVPAQEPAEPQHEPDSRADSTGPEIESPVGEVAPEPPEPVVVDAAHAPVELEPDPAPSAGDEPVPAADELRTIRGIGPKFERLLHAREVFTFRQIVGLENDEEWETYLETFPGRIEREDWRSQARDLHREKYGESI